MVRLAGGSNSIHHFLLYYSTLASILLYLYIMSISNNQYISRETSSMLSDLGAWELHSIVEYNVM